MLLLFCIVSSKLSIIFPENNNPIPINIIIPMIVITLSKPNISPFLLLLLCFIFFMYNKNILSFFLFFFFLVLFVIYSLIIMQTLLSDRQIILSFSFLSLINSPLFWIFLFFS